MKRSYVPGEMGRILSHQAPQRRPAPARESTCMNETFRRSLSMGLLCAPVGVVAGVYVFATATGDGYGRFVLAAPVAAFFSGTAIWWLVMARKARSSVLTGVLAGALAAVVGHFFCWYLLFAAAWVCHAVSGGCTDSLGGPPMNPLEALPAAALYAALSLTFVGWFTIPTGALLGGLLAKAQRRRVQTTNPAI